MKFIKVFVIAAALAGAVCCNAAYDDSEILERLNKLENDVAALQARVDRMNSDIAALQTLVGKVQSLEERVYVTSVKAFTEDGGGWIITFSDGDSITIHNGKDGASASAPVIGVDEVDGVLCWTVDGKVLTDSNEKPVPVRGEKGDKGDQGDPGTPGTPGTPGNDGRPGNDGTDGKTPQLKIEDGYWYVSYDGEDWKQLGPATSGSSSSDSIFKSVEVVGGNVVFTLSNGTVLTVPLASVPDATRFDETKIVLSLGAISDTHIGNAYGSEAKFTSALKQLKARASEKDPSGLAAVMVVGDLVNTASTSQISTFKSLYEGVLDPVKVPMIYTIGNHDMNPSYSWTAGTVTQNAAFHDIFGDDYFLTDQDQTMRKNFECRHCIVGNYHILAVTPNGTSPVIYDANTTSWLDRQLKEITAADPDRYVIVLTHPMIQNTVYGSNLGTYWYTSALTDILNAYPQVVTFSGHLHFPVNDPRSIWQGKFTSMGCASVSYMAFEGGDYENKKSATVLNDAGEYSEGLLVQFDANGNMRITRMDFYREAEIGSPWEVSFPAADGSHLRKYNHDALRAANSAPVLSTLSVSDGYASFAAGKDDEFVHHYSLTVKKGTSTVLTKNIMSDFYRSPRVSMMADSYKLSLGSLPEGDYTAELVAYDSWDAASEPLKVDFSVKSTLVEDVTPYLGTYSLKCKIFESGKTTIQSGEQEVTFSASGTTPDNILISGLYQNAVLPARLAVDPSSGKVRLGLSFDGSKGQKLSTPVTQGSTAYQYIAFLPGLGTQFINGNYNFKPCPITATDNSVCWWGDFSSDGKIASFNNANKQSLVNSGTNYYIIAISCVLSDSESLSASSLASSWNKVYQANPGNDTTTGMTFTKK